MKWNQDSKSQIQNVEWKSFLHDIIISRTQLFLRVQILTYWNFSRLFEWIRLSKLSLFASLTEYALYKDVATMTICNLCCDTISPSFPQSCHSPANVAHLEVVLTTVAYCLSSESLWSLGGVPIIFEVRLRSFSTQLSKSFSSDHKWNSTYFFVA